MPEDNSSKVNTSQVDTSANDVPSDQDWLLLTRRHFSSGDAFKFRHALSACATADGKYIITSPNADYIPQPVMGYVSVGMKADGKYGMEDPINWPQIYCPEANTYWYPCLPKLLTSPLDEGSNPWRRLNEAHDLLGHRGSLVNKLFILKDHRIRAVQPIVHDLIKEADDFKRGRPTKDNYSRQLHWIIRSAEDAYDRLTVPSTLRDLVRTFGTLQRYVSLAIGWLRWHTTAWDPDDDSVQYGLELRTDYMGAMTTDPNIVQKLFYAGIPVWYIRRTDLIAREDVILATVSFKAPDPSIVEVGDVNCGPIYDGPAGHQHLNAIVVKGHIYSDIEHVPFPHDYNPPSTSHAAAATTSSRPLSLVQRPAKSAPPRPDHPYAPKGRKPSKPFKPGATREGRSKFDDFSHERMPPALSIWQEALRDVDRSHPPTYDSEAWRYWLPEPAVVIAPSTIERINRHIRHWLQARTPWFYITRHRHLRRQLPVHWWRFYLNDGPGPAKPSTTSKKAQDKAKVKAKVVAAFEEVFKAENVVEDNEDPVWFGQVIANPPDATMCQQIAWELCEFGFRVELEELDRALTGDEAAPARSELIAQVFPAIKHWHLTTFPKHPIGLSSPNAPERIPCLNALRELMQDWPDVPKELSCLSSLDANAPADRTARVEKILARFYCQTFFNLSGRAAIIPRGLPGAVVVA